MIARLIHAIVARVLCSPAVKDELAALRSTRAELQAFISRANSVAQQRAEAVRQWSAEIPPRAPGDRWMKDDAQALTAFLVTPAGEKFMQAMATRLRDYEVTAIMHGTKDTAALLNKRAHGFRDALVEIKTLSAAGAPSSTIEPGDLPLPPDLEHLRG